MVSWSLIAEHGDLGVGEIANAVRFGAAPVATAARHVAADEAGKRAIGVQHGKQDAAPEEMTTEGGRKVPKLRLVPAVVEMGHGDAELAPPAKDEGMRGALVLTDQADAVITRVGGE